MFRRGLRHNVFSRSLQSAVVCLLAGLVSEILFPHFRVAILHLALMGGFAVITLTVATRVVYGHTGQRTAWEGSNRWFATAVVLTLLAMATRMSGDFWPDIMASHYNYGVAIWIAGLSIWAWRVLPNLRRPDPEE